MLQCSALEITPRFFEKFLRKAILRFWCIYGWRQHTGAIQKPGMTQPIPRDAIYKRRVFDAEVIELCVRWYIGYRLSYRDLVEIMAERGVQVAHITILRWVLRYVPEYEKRWGRFAQPVGTSWRMDETYISIRGRWHYLYRAVDKHGKTIDFLLRTDRGIAAAQAFFRKALTSVAPRVPRKITLDGMSLTAARCGYFDASILVGAT
jgi:transposase-like protein